MKMSVKTKNTVNLIIMAVGLIAALIIVFLVGREHSGELGAGTSHSGPLLKYSGWKMVRDNGTPLPVRTPSYKRTSNGSITIVNKLPEALESGAYLVFESTNTSVSVSIEETEVYQNRDDPDEQLLTMWNYVMLEQPQAGNQVSVTFTGSDHFDVGILPVMYLGPRAEVLFQATNEMQVNVQICVGIIFLGLFIMFFAMVTFADTGYAIDYFMLGLFISALGLSQWLQLAFPYGSKETWFAKQSLGRSLFGLLPTYYCFYRGVRTSAPWKKTYIELFWGSIVWFFLTYYLRWFGPASLWPTLRWAAIAVFELILAVCLYFTVFKENQDIVRYKTLAGASLVMLMLGIALEYFTHAGFTVMHSMRPMVLGALLFSLLQFTAVLFFMFDHAEQQIRVARELSESRIRLMMSQVKPHFIRSALGAIGMVIKQNPDRAYMLLRDFTNYISFNLESMDSNEPIPFAEELKHIKAYTNIEQERYRPRVKVEYEIGPEQFEVPPLTVQPYVENAIKHGVWARKEGGTVRLRTEETPTAWVVVITDDGVGFDVDNPPPALRGHGISMKNAAYRLREQVGGAVKVESVIDRGTQITITIPKGEKGEPQ